MTFARNDVSASASPGRFTGRPETPRLLPPRLTSCNGFFGDRVVDEQGQTLGSITDLWIDPALGQVVHAIVSCGGFMGRGERLYPVPWTALRHRAEQQLFVLVGDRTFFLAGPAVERRESGLACSAALERAVAAHYRDRSARSAM